jgi:hypothetical protein
MKERPILFNGAMVKAILDGRKTQTRRLVDFKKIAKQGGCTNGKLAWSVAFEGWAIFGGNSGADITPVMCQYGSVGDRLWVRETFYNDTPDAQDLEHVYYRADGTCCDQIPECQCASIGKPKWTPSLHMPRWASRITLEITDVRVQRVQEISAKDIIAEGAVERPHFDNHLGKMPVSAFDGKAYPDLRSLWGHGWNSIYKNYRDNPWLWAITFRKI